MLMALWAVSPPLYPLCISSILFHDLNISLRQSLFHDLNVSLLSLERWYEADLISVLA